MSLSNEQRAHDVALTALSYLLEKNSLIKTDESGEHRVDIYVEYRDLYKRMLESVNRDFDTEQ